MVNHEDERCSSATSGIFSDDSEDIDSDIYTIRKVSKQVFLNHETPKRSLYIKTRPLPPIPPQKPARLYLTSVMP